jgi:hypothetical protein
LLGVGSLLQRAESARVPKPIVLTPKLTSTAGSDVVSLVKDDRRYLGRVGGLASFGSLKDLATNQGAMAKDINAVNMLYGY